MIQAATIAWVIEAQGLYLVVEEDIDGQSVFNQPAGHWESGESLLEAAKRELKEETGLQLEPQGLLGLYRLELPHKTFWRHVFYARLPAPLAANPQDPDILACHWLSKAELEKSPLRSHLVLAAIEDFEAGVHHPLSVLRGA
ncbi:NUDIX domain-containing protein [Gallaecimonas kandeliae]|uniref:NUDIX domain-containing protein n=1 Tax=Gallaecimonas kandeliae TaxID=3029055 RepID=UPI00264994BC|nr:NUDIX domain-containing protein [Gallaecimonas kandeliae]WKE67243.1 NUDIX domain-containing protein [Gallaecimonas kandeliae]